MKNNLRFCFVLFFPPQHNFNALLLQISDLVPYFKYILKPVDSFNVIERLHITKAGKKLRELNLSLLLIDTNRMS